MKTKSSRRETSPDSGGSSLTSRALSGLRLRDVWWVRLAPVLLTLTALGFVYLLSGGFRSELGRAASILGRGDVVAIRDYILSYGVWAPFASLLLMVLQGLVAPVPTFVLTFANGLAFGMLQGWLLSVAGHALVAVVCFGIARMLGRRPVEALVGQTNLETADNWFARWGALAVLLARLAPGVAFDADSYAAGLTQIKFFTFLAATVIGVLPGTLGYAYSGSQASEYSWVLLALSALLSLGVAAAVIVRRR